MPPIHAVTIHSHRRLDDRPIRLQEEMFILLQKARINATSGNSQRFTDTSGNCFLRVESDARLQWSIDYLVLENDGLADYHPGRALSDRAIAFANGDIIPHQFEDDGIFIYESVTDEDAAGELRSGNVVVSYDMHTGLNTTTFPDSSADVITYSDVGTQATYTEITTACKTLMLEDVFYGESNLDATFTVVCYNGDPAAAGTVVATATETDAWIINGYFYNSSTYVASPNSAIVFDSSGSTRTVTHVRLKRGSNVIVDIDLDTNLTVVANTTLRIPQAALKISLYWGLDGLNTSTTDYVEIPSKYFLGYVLGGTRFTHIPEAYCDVEIWATDPQATLDLVPLDTFRVPTTSTYWLVSGTTVDPAGTLVGTNAAPYGDWTYTYATVRLANLPVWCIKDQFATETITAGATFSETAYPLLELV